jgi:hypothetical protein
MIVVRSNLYAGHAERTRKMRPRARVLMVVAVVVLAQLIFDLSQSWAVVSHRRQHAISEELAGELARSIEVATANVRSLEDKAARRDAILNFAAQRRNWAPLLARAFAAVPASVELTSLQLENVSPRKPQVRFAGKCMGAEPRLEADRCMLQITHAFVSAGMPMTGRFLTLEDSSAGLIGADNRPRIAEFVMQFTSEEGAHDN